MDNAVHKIVVPVVMVVAAVGSAIAGVYLVNRIFTGAKPKPPIRFFQRYNQA
jgi:hypothetical protein